jgi:hypothetical protein
LSNHSLVSIVSQVPVDASVDQAEAHTAKRRSGFMTKTFKKEAAGFGVKGMSLAKANREEKTGKSCASGESHKCH